MTADTQNALNIALSSHLRQLADLDLIQEAEKVVRNAYSERLLDNVDSVLRQLDQTTQDVAWSREGDNLVAIIESEQRLCGIQQLADAVLTRHSLQGEAAREAEAAYQAERHAICSRIEALQAALDTYQK